MKKDKHGVNLFELQRKYHFKVEEVMDFSSNINPIGPSKKALNYLKENIDQASVYPDPEYVDLLAEISHYSHASVDHILLGSGTTNLIKDYIHFIHPKKALLNSPCYSEYENELKLTGSQVFHYNLDYKKNFTIDIEEVIQIIQENAISLYVLTNPNNPTGTILNRVEIEKIIEATGVNILIDETYIEFTDKSVYSSAPLAATNEKIFVVRSTSKFFAVPGIRLGYGITSNQEVYQAMGKNFSLWGINIFAEMMGRIMFSDEAYKAVTYNHIQREKEKMISGLETVPSLKVFPSYGNFVLVKIKDKSSTAADLREFLLPKKIVIRDCTSFKNLDERFFRFCILSTEANNLLLQGIKEFFENA